MSLDRPWALALLAVPVLLLWLRLRAARPREAEASSLLVWSKVSQSDTPPARPRPPVAAWIEALGAAALALGLAGPWLPGPARTSVRVLLDTSPSMTGRAPPVEGATVQESRHPERDLPGLLASPEPVVVVTDHRLPGYEDIPGRLRVVGAGKPGFNAGITSASGVPLPDGKWRLFLAVEAYGAPGPVEGTLHIGESKESITVAPGRPLEVLRDIAAGAAEARIEFKGDVLPEDDAVELWVSGGRKVHLIPGIGAGADAVARAAAASGAVAGAADNFEGREGLVTLLGGFHHVSIRIPSKGEGVVRGVGVVGSDHRFAKDVRVDPGVELGVQAALSDRNPDAAWETILSNSRGPLVEARVDRKSVGTLVRTDVEFHFVPGGMWVERDPSFVVLVKNLVDHVSGGAARIAATGVLDPRETREAAEGETFGDLRAALEEARRPDPAARVSWSFALLMAGSALLALAWVALR